MAETEKQKQFSVARIATSMFGGLQFHNLGLKIPVIYLEDTQQPDCFTSQNKIIKVKLGSKGPGTKAGVVYSVHYTLH